MLKPYLLIAEITRPQGIRGQVKLRCYTDGPERFETLRRVYVKSGEGYEPLIITGCRVNGGDVFIDIKGVTDRDAAERLRGTKLYVDRANAKRLSEDEVFIDDIMGAKAYDTHGREIGALKDVFKTGSTDVFTFDTPEGDLMVPALKTVILEMNAEDGYITLDENRLSEVAVYAHSDTDYIPRDV